MYEFTVRGEISSDRERISRHTGSCHDFLRGHKEDCVVALQLGLRGVQEVAPLLLQRIAEPRTLRSAFDLLARKGGDSPGPNGRRYRDLTQPEVWDLCRCLGAAIRRGIYHPGPELVQEIPKTSGDGYRPIVLLNIEDRVVQRAIVLILQPLLDPLFHECSYGYRPHRNHLGALALAERLTIDRRDRIWVTEDVRDAFGSVPLARLFQVLHKRLPDRALIELLERALTGQMVRGLRQGGSLSPLAMNVYYDHFLDWEWQRRHPDVPMVRVADDIVLLCRTPKRAIAAHGELLRLLRPAGMPLHHTAERAVHDLGSGDHAPFVGFDVSEAPRGLAFVFAERSWARLAQIFAVAQIKSESPRRASRAVRAWLKYRGPCYSCCDRDQVIQRIASMAFEQAFEEIPPANELLKVWHDAYLSWRKPIKETSNEK